MRARIMFYRVCCLLMFTLVAGMCRAGLAEERPFAHPGILNGADDLSRMKKAVSNGQQPIATGFTALSQSRFASADYKILGPFKTVIRDPAGNTGKDQMEADVNAAYQNAIMWSITGDESHAKKTVEILNAWSSTLRTIKGHDAQLSAGLYGFLLTNAAEIMRSTYPKFKTEDVSRFQGMLKGAFYPVVKDYATFANGNWDGACIKMMMAIGVFCDDRSIFDNAVSYYQHGSGDGSIEHYVNDIGECQESGRDQQHSQLGLGLLAECCQVAQNQGVNLWDVADHRLLKGFEYTAKYNLGEDVPFVTYRDTTGRYIHTAISPQGRGKLRSIWEIAFAHYHDVEHLEMPNVDRVLKKIRPEGPPFGADAPGYGTLLFALPIATH